MGDRETLWGGRRGMATSSLYLIDGVPAMPQPNGLSRSLVALDQNSTIIAVIEMSQSSWLVAGMLPGIERQPRKKLEPRPERQIRPCQRESERHRRGAAKKRAGSGACPACPTITSSPRLHRSPTLERFVADSPLEEAGFEPLGPAVRSAAGRRH